MTALPLSAAEQARLDATNLRVELDRLEWTLAGASKLPWALVGGTHDREIIDGQGCHVATTGTPYNALLVVAAVNALQRMIELAAEAARLRETVARVQALAGELGTRYPDAPPELQPILTAVAADIRTTIAGSPEVKP